MNHQRAWTVAIIVTVVLLVWAVVITVVLAVFAFTGQPIALPAP